MPDDLTWDWPAEADRRVYATIMQIADETLPPYELGQLSFFADEDENFIRTEVERMLYEAKLPNGGEKERKMIERLRKLAQDTEWAGCGRALAAISHWQAVLPEDPRNAGRYYMRRPLSPKNKVEYEWAVMIRAASHDAKEWNRKWFAQMLLDGMPEEVSDFEMECLFLLRKSNGQVERLVRLKNILGEVSRGPHHNGSDLLDAKAYASPEKFREWCLLRGNFAWHGNQVELQKLHADGTHYGAWRIMNQIDYCGWYPVTRTDGVALPPGVESGIWFCEECAYADGELLKADEEGVYWWQGEGYYLNHKGRENEFSQRKPSMRPFKTDGKTPLRINGLGLPIVGAAEATEAELYRLYFREVAGKFFDTAGSYEGWLLMGSMFAFAAAPEIFKKHGVFPGCWIHGQATSGKTVTTEWAMHIWGYKISSGIGLLKGTAVGLLIQAENYSNQPLWVDEYRHGHVPLDKEAILRDAFNRVPTEKWSPDGVQRKPRTNFIVTGESTTTDAATRSRYPHVQISASKRKANHYEWMQAQKQNFFVFGRLLLERRAEFVALVMNNLGDWLASKQIAAVGERDKLVHGVVWSAWSAFAQMLNSHSDDEHSGFLRFMVEHAEGSAADVTSETNINVFWTDLLTAVKANAIPMSCFCVETELLDFPPGEPEQAGHGGRTGWARDKLFMDPDPVISALKIFLAKQRDQITLNRKDLRDQLSKSPGWMEKKEGFTKRFGRGGDSTPIRCWGFDLDAHPMGRQKVTAKIFEAYMSDLEASDPRRGPLYTLIHEWNKWKKGEK